MPEPAENPEIACPGAGNQPVIAALRAMSGLRVVDRPSETTRVLLAGQMSVELLHDTLGAFGGVVVVADSALESQLAAISPPTPARLIGLGSAAETIALRRAIGMRLKLAEAQVQAWVVGVIGKPALALWSSATAAGVPLHEWAVAGHGKLTVRDRIDLLMTARQTIADPQSPLRIEAAVRVIESIAMDRNDVLPVMRFIDRAPIPELIGRWLSLPCILNTTGAEPPLPLKLNDAESAALRNG